MQNLSHFSKADIRFWANCRFPSTVHGWRPTSANERMVRRSPVPWPTAILFLRHRRVIPRLGQPKGRLAFVIERNDLVSQGYVIDGQSLQVTCPRCSHRPQGIYSKGDFIRMLETRGWGRCQRQKRDAPAERFDGNERRLRTNQMQNVLHMRCGTI